MNSSKGYRAAPRSKPQGSRSRAFRPVLVGVDRAAAGSSQGPSIRSSALLPGNHNKWVSGTSVLAGGPARQPLPQTRGQHATPSATPQQSAAAQQQAVATARVVEQSEQHQQQVEARRQSIARAGTSTVVTDSVAVKRKQQQRGALSGSSGSSPPAFPPSHLPEARTSTSWQQQQRGVLGAPHPSSPSSPWPNAQAAVVFRQQQQQQCARCGGSGTVSAGQAQLPCPQCLGESAGGSAAGHATSTAEEAAAQLLLHAHQLIHLGPDDIQELDELIDQQPVTRVQRRRAPLTEEHRAKIRDALKGKYTAPKSAEHKRKISRAMQRMYSRNEALKTQRSLAATGKAKTCSLCGEEGHNRRGCPQNPSRLRAASVEGNAVAGASLAAVRTKHTCVICGQSGHNRRTCPERAKPQALAAASSRPKLRAISCSHCGSPDHNRRTCPVLKAAAVDGSATAIAAADAAFTHAQPLAAATATAASSAGMTQSAAAALQGALPSSLSPSPAPASAAVLAPPASPAQAPAAGLRSLPWATACGPPGLPAHMEESTDQAVAAVVGAWRAGVFRQRVDLLLGVGDEGTWPGGMRQQLKSAVPIVEALLLRLRSQDPDALGGRIMAEMLDEVECVAAWQSDKLAAVLFPTAESLPALRQLVAAPRASPATPTTAATDAAPGGEQAVQRQQQGWQQGDQEQRPRLILTINPQWTLDGQLVSDFGFGQARRDAERFLDSFSETYSLQRLRVMGDEVRLLHSYPHPWQAYYVPPRAAAAGPGGAGAPASSPHSATQQQQQQQPRLLGSQKNRPSYSKLLAQLKAVPGSRASMTWLDRVLSFTGGRSTSGGGGLLPSGVPLDALHPLLEQEEDEEDKERLLAATNAVQQLPPRPSAAALPSHAAASGMQQQGSQYREGEEEEEEGGGGRGAGSSGSVAATPAADRFRGDELDIITREPVRDLMLEPVQQLAAWQRSIFGSEQQQSGGGGGSSKSKPPPP